MKRVQLLIVILFLIGIFAILVYMRASRQRESLPPPDLTIPTPIEKPIRKIESKGVTINNPFDVAVESNQESSQFSVNESYHLVYFKDSDEFIINILVPSFEEARKTAEGELLQKLGITQDEACKLKVTIKTIPKISPDQAGKKYPLSFCQ